MQLVGRNQSQRDGSTEGHHGLCIRQTDRHKSRLLGQVSEHAIDALARHGGKVVHATRDTLVLDGKPDLPDVGVILSFPDRGSAESWINDPDLADIHNLRRGAGASDILLLA